MVQLRAELLLRLPPHLWLHHDDAAAVHQLQAQVSGAPAVAHDDLQGVEHVHRRHLRLRHQDAHPLPHRLLPRRCARPALPADHNLVDRFVFGFVFADIIFFIFLYQRWIYRVDPSRLNEFGFSQEMLESRDQATTAPAIADAATPPPVAEAAAAAAAGEEEASTGGEDKKNQ